MNVGTGTVALSEEEQGLLGGDEGSAAAFAMRLLMAAARSQGAPRLTPITAAHVDGCLYHGRSSLDFIRRLVDGGARTRVPTTLNVGGLDLSQPELFLGTRGELDDAAQVMQGYVALGCLPTFTCAPYQLPGRPSFGEDVAWAESNAIVFGNSVIGLRTSRYGDLSDICAAITGRVPYAGLHVSENRAARAVFTLASDALEVEPELLPALLGHHVGRLTGALVPAIVGLPPGVVTEDWCKSLGAAGASGGGLGMFHIVGVTPEAPDLVTATQGWPPLIRRHVTRDDLVAAHRELTTASAGSRLGGVSIGTPHLSRAQLVELARLVEGSQVVVPTYATTSRAVAAAEPEAVAAVGDSGVTVVRDTCIYGPSKVLEPDGAMMTNSAKWAYYAPAHHGYDVVLAGLQDCVTSAVTGRITVTALHG